MAIRKYKLYGVLRAMINRCCNEKNPSYKDYGGRGIIVCDEWLNDSMSFINWGFDNGWAKGLTIDREDNDGNYCPENCRFITKGENNKNRRLLKSDNTSGFRGVYLNKRGTCHWMAYVKVDYKMKNLGYHDTKEKAAKARDAYVVENNLGYALNFPDKK